jgi:carbon storage regulator CsrA
MSRFLRHCYKPGGLILTRKNGDRVIINHGELEIEVVQIHASRVRLAFYANKEISITRAESTPGPESQPDDENDTE